MPKLAHHVFFTLKDRSDEAISHLLDQCRQYLDNHEGLLSFDVGVRDRELDRPVNVDFDVSLHLVFADRPAHDRYQVCADHLKFIEQNKEGWEKVSVFDSTL